MIRLITVIALLVFSFEKSTAQKIHWASEVVNFSSQHDNNVQGDHSFSAQQILGVPNAIGPRDLKRWAWASKNNDGGSEHITVRFSNGVKNVKQIYIAENLNPGAITKIILYDNKGKKKVVYENKNPKPPGLMPYRMFRHTFSPTDFYVKECKVELNTKAVKGKNQIDAIGISDHHGEIKIKAQIDEIKYRKTVPSPENLGRSVNSSFAERLPIISPDGNTLYFTRKLHPDNLGEENKDDIWVARRKTNNQWSYAENIGAPLNTISHNFVVSVNPSGNALYLGNDYRRNVKDGLSFSQGNIGNWQAPKSIIIEDHYNDNIYVNYNINVNENVMILSVERKEGFGDRDLYVSFKRGKKWTKPKNMGRTINTVNIESSAFIAADNKTIYFSSNGHYTHGGIDVFMSKRLDDSWTKWSTPKNLGPKINSPDDDYNYTIPASGEYAYFSSRDNSVGMSDLFRILLPEEARPEPVLLMTGQIIDVSTNKPIQAKLKYNTLGKEKKKEEANIADAKDDGSYQVVLPYGENVEVYADIEGYFPVSESMELSNENLEELDSDSPDDPLLIYNDAPPTAEEKKLDADLKRLEKELEALKQKKKNKAKPSYTTAYDYDQSGIQTTRPSKPKPKAKTGKDSELEYLKNKYYSQLYGNSDEPKTSTKPNSKPKSKPNRANKNDKEVDSMYEKLYGKKKEEDQPVVKEEPASDPFNEEPNEVIVNNDAPSTVKPKKNNDEVDSMYEKLYGKKKEADQPVVKEEPKREPAPDPFKEPKEEVSTNEPPKDQPSFEEMEAKIRAELKADLLAQIRAELRDELMDEIKAELKKEADEKALEEAAIRLERENRKELDEIPSLKAEIKTDNIEEELKALILAEVKEELKEELEAPIKEELKDEVNLLAKENEKESLSAAAAELKKDRMESSGPPKLKENKDLIPEYVELNQNIEVVPIKVGQVIPMNNIFFDANKSDLKDESFTELERVLAFLLKNNNLVVEVGGHTNGWCSSSFADELSRGRSKRVMNYFIKNGVSENRVQYRGYGKTMPIADNTSLQGRKKNQRVELKILEILK